MKKNREVDEAFKQMADLLKRHMKNDPTLMDDLAKVLGVTQAKEPIKPVTAMEWKRTHPMGIDCGSDKFYANFANTLQRKLGAMRLPPNVPEGFVRETAMTIAAYLEDFVTDLGVWRTMRGLYRERFGTWLPFYDCSHADYAEDDVNIEDVQYLVWQALMRCGQAESRFFSPISQLIMEASEVAYDTLLDHIDDAPGAFRAKEVINIILGKDDYYHVRGLALWLTLDNKLTSVPNARAALELQTEKVTQNLTHVSKSQAYYLHEAIASWSKAVGMTGCPTNELLAALVRDYQFENVAAKLDTLKTTPLQTFKVLAQDSQIVTLQDMMYREYTVERASMGPNLQLNGIKSYYTQIVKYGNYWMQNGIASLSEDEPWKNEPMLVEEVPEEVVKGFRAKVKKGRGRRVFYFKSIEEISKFINLSLPVSTAKLEETPENLLVLVSDTDDPLFVNDVCFFFKDKDNPFYAPDPDEDFMSTESLAFIADHFIPDDVAEYIQKKRLLPHARIFASQGSRVGKSLVQDNLRYLCGFFRAAPAEV